MDNNKKKPYAKLVGEDGNIFNLIGIARRALNRAGMSVEADEMANRIYKSENYTEALGILMEYVDVNEDESQELDEDIEMEIG